MNLLHICSTYCDRPLFKTLFEAQKAIGINNLVYVPRWSNKEVEDNVHVISKKFSKLGKLLYWGEQRYILQDIENKINLNDIDVIHVHRILYGGYAALTLSKKYEIPYVVAVRNSDIYGFGRTLNIFRKHSLEILMNAKKVIFISKVYMDLVIERYIPHDKRDFIRKKSEVITNGIDEYFLAHIALPKKKELTLNKKKEIRLISIADIDKNKNLLTTIKVCMQLISEGYDVKLKCFGKVINNKIFKKVIQNNFVEYLGVQPKEILIKYLHNSDIFIMPSVHETFGLVYAEAMSQGLPVIYTKGQGFDGQYENGEVGYAVDCFNIKEIACRIKDIISDYQNISCRCVINSERYSWTEIAKYYAEIYETCL